MAKFDGINRNYSTQGDGHKTSEDKKKENERLLQEFLARGGKIQKIAPGVKSDADKVKSKKRPLAAQKDSSDELAGGKPATGQKVSKVDTRPNIREV